MTDKAEVETFPTDAIAALEVRIIYKSGTVQTIHLKEEPEAKLETSFSITRHFRREFRGEEGTPSDESRVLPTGVSSLKLEAELKCSPEHPTMKAESPWVPADKEPKQPE